LLINLSLNSYVQIIHIIGMFYPKPTTIKTSLNFPSSVLMVVGILLAEFMLNNGFLEKMTLFQYKFISLRNLMIDLN
jgi:hypothetical protein